MTRFQELQRLHDWVRACLVRHSYGIDSEEWKREFKTSHELLVVGSDGVARLESVIVGLHAAFRANDLVEYNRRLQEYHQALAEVASTEPSRGDVKRFMACFLGACHVQTPKGYALYFRLKRNPGHYAKLEFDGEMTVLEVADYHPARVTILQQELIKDGWGIVEARPVSAFRLPQYAECVVLTAVLPSEAPLAHLGVVLVSLGNIDLYGSPRWLYSLRKRSKAFRTVMDWVCDASVKATSLLPSG